MSKIGKTKIVLPDGVSARVSGDTVSLAGPKGEASLTVPKGLSLLVDATNLSVRQSAKGSLRALHGTTRALIANMVTGVYAGWTRRLELVGAGFRAETDGKRLTLVVGFSHPVVLTAPEGISFKVEKNIIEIAGIDRALVGETASKIRSIKPPEPYKGKGIRFEDEYIRKKVGKAAKTEGMTA